MGTCLAQCEVQYAYVAYELIFVGALIRGVQIIILKSVRIPYDFIAGERLFDDL